MAQYTSISATVPLVITDGVDNFQYTVVDGTMYLQQIVDASWEDIEEYTDAGGGVWRMGVRSLHWVVDCTITATGFSGTENTDWLNIEQHKIA